MNTTTKAQQVAVARSVLVLRKGTKLNESGKKNKSDGARESDEGQVGRRNEPSYGENSRSEKRLKRPMDEFERSHNRRNGVSY